ncbi:cation-translocating P-type ATPase [Microvirga splendida]|uniref:Cadmium-translocating P-type ATPase n=1 Tax=Microvirga splendida TaxID=2795727 RepID=A0ABS0Y111_9HYPH|nr:cation-translocating P-type ATPase [Microvirga splendida]MBJ6125628.1 cadmium-translocating P-type ATPase [Microvirga splendida]
MTCCAPIDVQAALGDAGQPGSSLAEIRLASRDLGDGTRQTDLSVPGVHCAACIAAVERTLRKLPGIEAARVNLSMKRVAVTWRTPDGTPPDLIGALRGIGYEAHLFAIERDARDPELARLVKALALAGFCAMNIMMLSVSVWAGADASSRKAFHLISALLALPALLYSGRIFYTSAWSALRHGRTNMDVPISIGVSLAFALSLYDTLHNAPHAYFDAATSLLFFLLIGRTLDHVMRERARSAVAGLARLAPAGATTIRDGQPLYVPVCEIEPGAVVLVAAGERIPVDGAVEQGTSELDRSLVSGESAPRKVAPGEAVQAGVMNLTGPLTVRATARAEDSFLAEMVRMMEAAEGGRARYRRLADRAAALYSPVVHTLALLSFMGWLVATGDWHVSVTIAIAVLIITCPCALGLAVPIVQVVAARRLFESGIMVKDGSALERLAEIDGVAFDKTGTLTLGRPTLVNADEVAPAALRIAQGMAMGSRHPAARAIVGAAAQRVDDVPAFDLIEEVPGLGLEGQLGDDTYRLGRSHWAVGRSGPDDAPTAASISVLGRDGEPLATFVLEDRVRRDARETVDGLKRQGLAVEILSGDRAPVVEALALRLGIRDFAAGLLPAEKVARVAAHEAAGRKVMMVGDGLNDAPALSAAYVSMAPATAADIGRNAADFVFLNESLSAVTDAIEISRRSRRLVLQNFALAVGYNALAVPVAVLGYVTPLVAAVAMSLSSIIVVANAMRLSPAREAA